MPINFACPRCSRRLTIATRKAGAEVPCPSCGQRILVPTPPPVSAPLPGILIEPAPGAKPPSASFETDVPTLMADPKPVEKQYEEPREPERDEDYEPIRRRRKKSGRNRRFWLMAGIGGIGGVLLVPFCGCPGIWMLFSHDNARCPACQREFYITEKHRQKIEGRENIAQRTRSEECPNCGIPFPVGVFYEMYDRSHGKKREKS